MTHFNLRTRRYRVGVTVELLGFLVQCSGVASPCWIQVPWSPSNDSGGVACVGLWQICHGGIWNCDGSNEKPQMVAWGLTARVLCIAALCISVGSLILLITSNCTDHARRTSRDLAAVWWLPLCAGIINIASIALYMIDVRVVMETGSPSWSLIMTGTGSIMTATTAWFLFPTKERQPRGPTSTVPRARGTPPGARGGSPREDHVNIGYNEAPPTYEEATRDTEFTVEG